MYGVLDISVSGMVAQRVRMDTIAANLANRDTILDAEGNPNPFRRRSVIFTPGDPDATSDRARQLGVHVSAIEEDQGDFRKVWDPDSPYARPVGTPDAGYVYFPNVDSVTENINAVDAVRAYEANVAAAEATKSMLAQALRLIA
ncbi:MAG: flagellar basal body rod protein FlgC [Planctomycetota bacterium]|nr:flagellar basal body rod protein FlgC [Planctomycetota bacterium]